MPIALSVVLFDRGANGAPTTSNPEQLRGQLDAWEQTISDRFGYESARAAFRATARQALGWARADHLRRAVEVYTPQGHTCWEGYLAEIEVTIGRVRIALSLTDMANRVLVRYSTSATGAQGASASYSHAASIATYGTKDRLLQLGNVSATAAANRAQTALTTLAWPRSTQATESGSGAAGEITVTLTFAGWYATLDDLLTTSSSTATTATDVQLVNLLTAYNSTNPFFATDRTNVVATGVSDTEGIDPDTTYREKIEALLSQGDSAHQRLHWGCFDDRAFVVRRWAGASPETITYRQSLASGRLTDAYGNVVAPWDARPDAMVQIDDVLEAAVAADMVDSAARYYCARTVLRVDDRGVSVRLEPDQVASLEDLLANPGGSGAAGESARQAGFERLVHATARTRFPAGDLPSRYNGGIWQPGAGGTGVNNTGTIDTGGGDITNTGGGNVDLGTGTGIGGSGSTGVSTAGAGTVGRLTQWATPSTLADATLIKSGAGVLTLSAASAYTLTIAGSIALSGAGANSGDTLVYNGTAFVPSTLTAADVSAAPNDAKYIVQQSSSELAAEQALGSLATGILKNTTSSGVLSIAVAGTDYAAASHTHPHGDITDWNEAVDDRVGALLTAGANITLTYNDAANTLTIAADNPPVDGSGTAGRVAQWNDSNTIEAATLIKSGAGLLTLSAASAYTLTVSGSINLDGSGAASGDVLTYNGTRFVAQAPAASVGGSGTTGRMAQWASSSALEAADLIKSGAGVLTLSAASTRTLTVSTTGTAIVSNDPRNPNEVAIYVSNYAVGGNPGLTYNTGSNLLTVDNVVDIISGGAYRVGGTQVLGARRTGWSGWTGTATRSSKATSTATTQNVAEALKALIDDLISHGVIGA
jgi:autotransporter-associated beta strand protein